ncbi:MAG: hypothetical protein ACI8TX_000568 [Hyphomicrobiaceae bacterium]
MHHTHFRADPNLRIGGYELIVAGPLVALVGVMASRFSVIAESGLIVLAAIALLLGRFQFQRRATKMWDAPAGPPRFSILSWGVFAALLVVWTVAIFDSPLQALPAATMVLGAALALVGWRERIWEWGGCGITLLSSGAAAVAPWSAAASGSPAWVWADVDIDSVLVALLVLLLPAVGLAVNRRLLWPRRRATQSAS